MAKEIEVDEVVKQVAREEKASKRARWRRLVKTRKKVQVRLGKGF